MRSRIVIDEALSGNPRWIVRSGVHGCMGCTGLYRQVCSDLKQIERVKQIIEGPKEIKELRIRNAAVMMLMV